MSEYKHAVDFAQRHSVWVFWTGCVSRGSDCNINFRISFTNKNQPNSDLLKFLNIGHYVVLLPRISIIIELSAGLFTGQGTILASIEIQKEQTI